MPRRGASLSEVIKTMPNESEELMQQLKSSRLIKIFIGECPEPFLVQETLLTNSSDYFVKAIAHENNMGNDEPDVLRFPKDGHMLQAWGVLLFWIVNKRLPATRFSPEALLLLTEAWVLADKYLLPKLQNAVMMRLIGYFHEAILPSDVDTINAILRITPTGTPLRRFFAEEVVVLIYGGGFLKSDDLSASDGTPGLCGSLLAALEAFMERDRAPFWRMGERDGEKVEMYKEYLVKEDFGKDADMGD